jgi:hypothetical protein
LLAGISWLALAIGGAQGASIIETVPFSILAPTTSNLPPQTLNVSTPQFNPSLGTLETATTTIAGTVDIALEFFSTGAGGPYDIFLSDTLSLNGIPGLFGEELTGTVPANQGVFTAPVTIPFGPVDLFFGPAGAVVGSGTWNQLYSLPFPSFTVLQSPGPVLVPGLMVSGSSVTTYTYTPVTATVPEPRFPFVPALLFTGVLEIWNWRRKRVKAFGQYAQISH